MHSTYPASFLTRLLISLLRKRKDVLYLTVEILLPGDHENIESDCDCDEILDKLVDFEAIERVDMLNRIYEAN